MFFIPLINGSFVNCTGHVNFKTFGSPYQNVGYFKLSALCSAQPFKIIVHPIDCVVFLCNSFA